MKRVPRAFCQDSPLNTAMDVAGPVADDDSSEIKSFFGEYAECCTGKLKATPGYDRLYVPLAFGSSDLGGTYSPPYVGPNSLSYTCLNLGPTEPPDTPLYPSPGLNTSISLYISLAFAKSSTSMSRSRWSGPSNCNRRPLSGRTSCMGDKIGRKSSWYNWKRGNALTSAFIVVKISWREQPRAVMLSAGSAFERYGAYLLMNPMLRPGCSCMLLSSILSTVDVLLRRTNALRIVCPG